MHKPFVPCVVAAAFAAGFLSARITPPAGAQSSPPGLSAGTVNLLSMTEAEIGPLASGSDLRSRTLVATEQSTVAVQSGDVVKHFHADANEIQLILDGAGSFWLGDREVQARPGDLIIIPKGTPALSRCLMTSRV